MEYQNLEVRPNFVRNNQFVFAMNESMPSVSYFNSNLKKYLQRLLPSDFHTSASIVACGLCLSISLRRGGLAYSVSREWCIFACLQIRYLKVIPQDLTIMKALTSELVLC